MKYESLTEHQEDALKDLKACIIEMMQKTVKSEQNPISADMHEPNTIGIFGGRGAGKSTLLHHLYHRSQHRDCKDNREYYSLLNDIYLIDPIDCLSIDKYSQPSAIMLLTIKNKLTESLEKTAQHSCHTKLEQLLSDLDAIIGQCARTGKDYRKLCLELSTSPADFDHYRELGIQERLALKQRLHQWLHNARDVLNIKAFLILLDDFDLCSATQVRLWIKALLDELHQFGLIFVVTADFYRLEYLNLNRKEQLDDKTGRALINKIFPPKNCIQMQDWGVQDVLQFSSKNKSTVTMTLDKYLNCATKDASNIFQPLILSLLPSLPRGVESLYEKLSTQHKSHHSSSDDNVKPTKKAYKHALCLAEILASCRNEPLLARLIHERQSMSWLESIPLNGDTLLAEQWQILVDTAYKRPKWTQDDLLPSKRLVALKHILPAKDKDKQKTATWGSDEHAPLLHQLNYTRPLRDAAEADQALWAEFLLDLDFHDFVRDRICLYTTWRPIVSRLNAACLCISFSKENLSLFFRLNRRYLSKAVIAWMKKKEPGTTPKNDVVCIGWHPLFHGLRGETDPLSSELLNELLSSPGNLTGNIPGEEQLEILPNRLWGLIALADALHRCPWSAFSAPSNWLASTYIALAAALVRTAYCYTLVRSGYLEQPAETSEQYRYIRILENRDCSVLLAMNEEDLWLSLWRLFNGLEQNQTLQSLADKPDEDPVLAQLKDSPDSCLVPAARCYLRSPMYQDAVALLKDNLVFYRVLSLYA